MTTGPQTPWKSCVSGSLCHAVRVLVLCLCTRSLSASEPENWPGWRGPDPSGVARSQGLLPSWPAGGPRLLGRSTEAGRGYSTPSVVGAHICLLGAREGDTESLIALSWENGRLVWALPFGRTQGVYPGPRSPPTWHDGQLYVISSNGKLLCADAHTGQAVWTRDLVKDFDGQCGPWAYAESPLLDEGRLVVTPGGPRATIVALNPTNGAVLWTCAVDRARPPEPRATRKRRPYSTAAYSSIVPATIAGVRQYIQFLDGGVVGVSAKDGRLLWAYDEPASPVANCMTPIVHGDVVFAASAYNTGGGAARIVHDNGQWRVQPLWFLKDFQNHHGGVVLIQGFLYGTVPTELLCVEFETGRIAGRNPSVGKGSVVAAGSQLYARSENGPIALVEARPEAYTERGRFEQPDRSSEKAWPHLVIVRPRMLVRDQSLLLCYDLAR